jgi:ABC-type multidrug transport system ATPase subunit/uncharacterized tellurite resistance protein B-like protein
MSEPVLQTLLRLFALVASENGVSDQERKKIRQYLNQALSEKTAAHFAQLFEKYASGYTGVVRGEEQERMYVRKICSEISNELTRKQKAVIVMDLMEVILADGTISDREERLMNIIREELPVPESYLPHCRAFVQCKKPQDLLSGPFLVIDAQPQSVADRHLLRPHLKGFIAVCYFEDADTCFMKYAGSTEVFWNGVLLPPGPVRVLATGSSLRWENDEPVYYGELLALFRKPSRATPISFEANDISFRFQGGKYGLRNVSVAEESGRLIALMGSSGAGKSTLLNVLNGTDRPTEGEVLINGIDMHRFPERIEGIIGFVPQDDLLIEELTVYQNLYYAARLCFSHMREEETEFLVEKTLDDLGLNETRNLTVGHPLKKTISGGQRKRLNIGLELLREPAVLFVDEPTSGLSSRDSENIIQLLKELSLKGKLVFAVIHQPSSDIFKMFDRLVILDTGGYQIYYGNPVDAIPYFKQSVSMLDSHQGECTECGNVNPEQIFNIIESKVINEFGNFSNERKISPQEWNRRFLESTRRPPLKRTTASLVSSLNIPGWLNQVRLFFARDLTGKLHNTQYLVINLLEAPLLAFLLAFIVRYHNIDDKLLPGYVFSKNLNLPAYLFMSVIVALFMGLTVSAEEIFRDRKILKRESFLHLSRGSYLVSKVLILFMISAIQTLSFVLVGNLILGIKGMVLTHWLVLFTSSCMANLLGLNISSAFNSAVTIYILIPILLIPQLILSGVVVKFDKLNPTIGNSATVPAVGDFMASRWAFEAAMVSQFKDNHFERQFYPYDKAMAESDYKRIYYIPDLESRLDFCMLNHRTDNPGIREKVGFDLGLIQRELERENKGVDAPKFGHPQLLTLARFDTAAYRIVGEHMVHLKRFYTNRFSRAEDLKERIIGTMTASTEGEDSFEKMKENYQNETIAVMVKNLEEQHRIIEKDGWLIQKIYPIYKDPEPEHIIDFDAQFYMPAKHFLNRNIDTLFFNTGVIWSMTLLLYITLYFDVLRKILELPQRFRRR